jgi:ribonuclease D
MALPAAELPPSTLSGDGPPPPAKWAIKDPRAAARLTAARVGLNDIASRISMPVENLISPDLVRRTMWTPPDGADLAAALAAGGARPWQVELTTGALRAALDASAPAAPTAPTVESAAPELPPPPSV